jgi:hypothetical protein
MVLWTELDVVVVVVVVDDDDDDDGVDQMIC